MARTAPAFISHSVLRWARERRSVSEADVAKRLGTSAERIRSWETGASDDHPTLRQAQSIATALRIPLGYLYLSEPPSLTTQLPDLRTASGQPIRDPSPDFLDQLYDVQRKQEWYRGFREAQGSEPRTFVGKFAIDSDPAEVARDIRDVIGINDSMRAEASSWEAFLTAFARKAEAAGVLVFRSGVVAGNTHRALSASEFKGFAIVDELAPVVFINSKDYKVSQTFTLAHELAHIWIGESGVSSLNYRVVSDQQTNAVDRQCDKIAAEVLVPTAQFTGRWNQARDANENIRILARQYRVSRFVALRRARELGLLPVEEFENLYEDYRRDHHDPSGDGGNFYNLFFARNSTTLTFALLSASAAGQISRIDAARLLNVRVGTLEKARNELYGAGSP